MKESCKVVGFPRSGNHYIASLIAKNFYNQDKWTHLLKSHLFYNYNQPTTFIYIKRDFESVARSLFMIRDRFGLDENDYNRFLERRLSNMYNDNMKSEIYTNRNGHVETINIKVSWMETIDMTLKQFWSYHITKWNVTAHNVIHIQYETLLTDFQSTMLKVAKGLESDKVEFINIKEKKGWFK